MAEVLSTISPLNLDPDFDGACPRATIKGEDFKIDIHCWRVGRCCKSSGVHVTGTIPLVNKAQLAAHILIHNGWKNHTDWDIQFTVCEG